MNETEQTCKKCVRSKSVFLRLSVAVAASSFAGTKTQHVQAIVFGVTKTLKGKRSFQIVGFLKWLRFLVAQYF